MAVISDGSYDAPQDVVFGFPVKIQNKSWTIVKGLPMDDWSKEKFSITAKELEEERDTALTLIK